MPVPPPTPGPRWYRLLLVAGVGCILGGGVLVGVDRLVPSRATFTPTPEPAPSAGDCASGPRIPEGHYLGADVSALPVLAESATYTASLAAARYPADKGGAAAGPNLVVLSGRTLSGPAANRYPEIPVNLIPDDHPLVPVNIEAFPGVSDAGPFPDPTNLRWQGWNSNGGNIFGKGAPLYDGIVLAVRPDCVIYEALNVRFNPLSQILTALPKWNVDGMVRWEPDLLPRLSQAGAPKGSGSGEPFTPQVLRRADLSTPGGVNHVLHFYTLACRGGAREYGQAFVWPARLSDCTSDSPDPSKPPYGTWLRLRADYPAPTDAGAAAVVAGLKRHGMIVGDGGGQGIAAEDLPAGTTAALESIPMTAFEAVDTSSMRANPSASVTGIDYWTLQRS